MDPSTFLEENLRHVEGAIRATCARRSIHGDEVEEFASHIRYKLVEDDYRIIRKFSGKSSFKTYLYTVIGRIFIDKLRERDGRWRPSEKAKKMGETAVQLEKLLYNHHYSFDEAYTVLTTNHNIELDIEEAHEIAKQLPVRTLKRMRDAGDEPLINISAGSDRPDELIDNRRLGQAREKLDGLADEIKQNLSSEDRLILKMRFEDDIKVSAIARTLNEKRSHIDRRIKTILREFKEGLLSKGINANDALEVIRTIGEI